MTSTTKTDADIAALRHAVRSAWMSGVDNFREHYDLELLRVLGCVQFQDLYDPPPRKVRTQEEVLRDAFVRGGDPHTAWAAYLFNKLESMVTPSERRYAKNANYHLLYSTEFMSSITWPPATKEQIDDPCIDEGCPQHGKDHICISRNPNIHLGDS